MAIQINSSGYPTQGLLEPAVKTTSTGLQQTIKPIETGLKPEETVEGRAYNIMDKKSPLMELAETYGLQLANKRGLLDSGAAASLAQNEITKVALPIAQQDAGAMQQQKQAILQGDIQENQYGTQADYSSQLSKQTADQDLTKTKYVEAQTTARADKDNQLRWDLAGVDVASRDRLALNEAVTGLNEIFTEQVAMIQRDPNVAAINKPAAIASAEAAYMSGMKTLEGIFNTELTFLPLSSEFQDPTGNPGLIENRDPGPGNPTGNPGTYGQDPNGGQYLPSGGYTPPNQTPPSARPSTEPLYIAGGPMIGPISGNGYSVFEPDPKNPGYYLDRGMSLNEGEILQKYGVSTSLPPLPNNQGRYGTGYHWDKWANNGVGGWAENPPEANMG